MINKKYLDKIYVSKKFRILLVIIILVCSALLLLPTLPSLGYQPKDNNYRPSYPVSYITDPNSDNTSKIFITNGNRLFIPRIDIDTKILEGNTEDILLSEEGVWREPDTAIPSNPGNIVIAGHRFQYLPPNTTTFYNLDKLENNDLIQIYWEGKEYTYQVHNKFEVNPDELWIKNQTEENELTLYTCTPIYTSDRRLVIKAKLI